GRGGPGGAPGGGPVRPELADGARRPLGRSGDVASAGQRRPGPGRVHGRRLSLSRAPPGAHPRVPRDAAARLRGPVRPGRPRARARAGCRPRAVRESSQMSAGPTRGPCTVNAPDVLNGAHRREADARGSKNGARPRCDTVACKLLRLEAGGDATMTTLRIAGIVTLTTCLIAGAGWAADTKQATDQVVSGAKKVGEGVEQTAKGVG